MRLERLGQLTITRDAGGNYRLSAYCDADLMAAALLTIRRDSYTRGCEEAADLVLLADRTLGNPAGLHAFLTALWGDTPAGAGDAPPPPRGSSPGPGVTVTEYPASVVRRALETN